MGRRRIQTLIQDVSDNENSESRKNKHRCADSKYRQKMQYLFDLLKENFEGAPTKDNVLNAVLESIINTENDIIHLAGSEGLSKCKKEFLHLIELEEHVWKKEKDPSQWWGKIQKILEQVQKADNSSSISAISSNLISQWISESEILPKKRPVTRKRVLKPRQAAKVPNDSAPLEIVEENSHAVCATDSLKDSEEPPRKCCHTDEYIQNISQLC